ncbi:MAG: DUF4080 domain-containing protein [Butyrivibrio sp.]
MDSKKFLLVAVNSKYIHSNPAVYCLKNAAGVFADTVDILECTVNNHRDDILEAIYNSHPGIIGFSCYIWNISVIKELIGELAKILPDVPVWLGGPEVTYNPLDYVGHFPNVAGVMKGEGERIFAEVVKCYATGREMDITRIPGVTVECNGTITDNPCPDPIDLDTVAVTYDPKILANKIVYYESSRGCPFSCSYCLSSVDKRLRFKNIRRVKEDLKLFIDNEVPQVKFIDRTFNCKKDHAMEIWQFIKDNDRGITNFHFEIAGDILDSDEIELLNSLRPGLVQLEIGVQSTNPHTLKAIRRNTDIAKLAHNVSRIRLGNNIHIHLDLIAGLPYEDFSSFRKSFNDIYAMEPHQLQLGFLKLLHGSSMEEEAGMYGIIARSYPPYEVLYTKWLSYEEMLLLKQTENVVDMYYNSAMFGESLRYLCGFFTDAFSMYLELGAFYDKRYVMGSLPSRNGKYDLLHDFAAGYMSGEELEVMSALLKKDYISTGLKRPK